MAKTLTTEEAFCEIFKTTYEYLDKTTKLTIDFYEKQYKRYEKQIVDHLEEEPPKFFKKTHKKWQDELDSLNDSRDKAFSNYLEECQELYKLHTM